MKYLRAACSLAMLIAPGIAQATTVYSGCAIPSLKPGHRTFYVDPAKGSKAGDGSPAKPWRTLAEVLDRSTSLVATQGHNERTWSKGDASLVAVNPKGVIKPGDVILLMSGNHGSLIIQNNLNSDFITVMAAPGQTPVVQSLGVVSSSKWLFQGIKFQSLRSAGASPVGGIVNVATGDWLGPTSEIVFDNSSFSAADNTSSWSAADWLAKPFGYALSLGGSGSCIALTNNHFYNVMNGVQMAASKSVAQGNLIEAMSNDGIDMMASNLLIKGNTIRNGVNNAAVSTLHADGIQGWSLTSAGKVNTNTNVVIDSNTIVKTGDPKQSYLQGITIFDGKWDGTTISNNMIVSNDFQGISMSGGSNTTIVNNTVIGSSASAATWIAVTKAKDGTSAVNTLVRNNIATALQITSPGVVADHNIIGNNMALLNSSGVLARLTNGASGTNKIIPSVMNAFVTLNNASASYDLRLRSDSPAVAYGIATQAPAVDIVGKARKPSVSAGAYN